MRVYVGQYGYFWSLHYEEWVKLCKECANGEGYDLSSFKQLKTKPSGLLKDFATKSYYPKDNEMLYVEPLDWYAEDFAEWLQDNGHYN